MRCPQPFGHMFQASSIYNKAHDQHLHFPAVQSQYTRFIFTDLRAGGVPTRHTHTWDYTLHIYSLSGSERREAKRRGQRQSAPHGKALQRWLVRSQRMTFPHRGGGGCAAPLRCPAARPRCAAPLCAAAALPLRCRCAAAALLLWRVVESPRVDGAALLGPALLAADLLGAVDRLHLRSSKQVAESRQMWWQIRH
jgi:hypothetical protein